ncbi:MAG: glyoxalase [Hoeflea sp.]|uniref:VOC family protein n=1 Tax=Hoeflea sp. TaxID=1940281 RepID=UPI000C110C1A|nr:VOC family protein [Hoeflea sp.]PHR18801.1 MAG: glyoxalase [Hoeflea sp.]|tara:strand:- start:32329 stop:32925 length:597 start_codon:yes stop_codon:yes gene_type:complete
MKHSILAIAALAVTLGALPAKAETLPGVRGVNHIGLTVPDINEAETFFSDVLGCEKATSFGPFRDDTGTFMQDLLDVDPRAVVNQITLMRCGFGSNIELFSYDAPDQQTVRPRNSDIGGHHIGFYVDDIDAAAAYFKDKGIRTLMGPFPVNEGPAAGQSVLYFFAPWGLQMEAISFPKGMAYEKDGGPVLWSNTEPAK